MYNIVIVLISYVRFKVKGFKDHYIAQTYLRSFSIKDNQGYIHAIRKSNLKILNNIPIASICYRVNWSSNPYFSEKPRVVEDYLKIFEPEWSNCLKTLSDEKFDSKIKYLLSGYIAYLRACTPTAIRLGQNKLSGVVYNTYKIIEAKELINPNSKHKDTINTINSHGGIKVSINPNYPKAMSIRILFDLQNKLQSFPWLIMKNETEIPFITSDNPVCLRYPQGGAFCDFYVSLTPKVAILIHPIQKLEFKTIDSLTSIKPEGVNEFNSLVVKCAEDMIIFNEDSGTRELVERFQNWRIESLVTKLPLGKNTLNIYQERPICTRMQKNDTGENN